MPRKTQNVSSPQLFITLMLMVFPLCVLLAQEVRIVGYLPYYRFYLADQIKMEKLTHLCIGFANPDLEGNIDFGDADIAPIVRQARQDDLKVLLSVGGGALEEEWGQAWDSLLLPATRSLLVERLVQFMLRHELDGLDIDLEWDDVTEHYSGFVLELRDSLDVYGKMLTAALPGHHRYPAISDEALRAFDFINLMAYDLTGPWQPDKPGQHSPYSLALKSINYWKNQGMPPDKLTLGLPFFGWDFTHPDRVTAVSYRKMVKMDSSFALLDQVGQIYYNGIPLIEAKTELAISQVSGIMFWELGQDAFGEHSLLEASYKVVQESRQPDPLGEVREITALPISPPKELNLKGKPVADGTFYLSLEKGRWKLKKHLGKIDPVLFHIPDYPPGLYLFLSLLK